MSAALRYLEQHAARLGLTGYVEKHKAETRADSEAQRVVMDDDIATILLGLQAGCYETDGPVEQQTTPPPPQSGFT